MALALAARCRCGRWLAWLVLAMFISAAGGEDIIDKVAMCESALSSVCHASLATQNACVGCFVGSGSEGRSKYSEAALQVEGRDDSGHLHRGVGAGSEGLWLSSAEDYTQVEVG